MLTDIQSSMAVMELYGLCLVVKTGCLYGIFLMILYPAYHCATNLNSSMAAAVVPGLMLLSMSS